MLKVALVALFLVMYFQYSSGQECDNWLEFGECINTVQQELNGCLNEDEPCKCIRSKDKLACYNLQGGQSVLHCNILLLIHWK